MTAVDSPEHQEMRALPVAVRAAGTRGASLRRATCGVGSRGCRTRTAAHRLRQDVLVPVSGSLAHGLKRTGTLK